MIKLTAKIQSLLNSSLLAVSLISIQSICHADEYVKDGKPCVKEICVGDGLGELSKINWKKSILLKPPQYFTFAIEHFNKDYRGDLKKSKDYLLQKTFDSTALKYFSDVKAYCGNDFFSYPTGTYTSKDGNQTEVTISLEPDAINLDSLDQKWTVVKIRRQYMVKSDQQRREIFEANNERYKSLTEAPGSGYNKSDFFEGSLILTFNHRPNVTEQAKLNPLCGGSEKVKID